jgi:hypothetical protein
MSSYGQPVSFRVEKRTRKFVPSVAKNVARTVRKKDSEQIQANQPKPEIVKQDLSIQTSTSYDEPKIPQPTVATQPSFFENKLLVKYNSQMIRQNFFFGFKVH